jgi:hypothetical protein
VRVLSQRGVVLVSIVAVTVLAGCDDRPKTGPGLEPPHPVVPGGTGTTGAMGQGGSGGSGAPGTGGRTTVPGGSGTGGAGTSVPPPSMGTGGAPGEDADVDAGSEPVEDAGMFTGFWVVDQPSHALYEATLYELRVDGTVNVGPTDTSSGAEPWPGFVTGTVQHPTTNVRCDLRGPWDSPALRTLQLESTCADGTPRTVVLTFPDLDPAVGVMPSGIEVEGASGWTHPGFPWAWRKCGSAPCMPF